MTLSIILITGGVLGYILNVFLIRYFIRKNDPVTWRYKHIKTGNKYAWENTANKGVVPKWVSRIGIISMNCFLIGIFIEIISLFKN